MRNLIKNLKIEKIEFQSNINEVSVLCESNQDGTDYRSELIINFSDLNRLISKIQKIMENIEIFSLFKKTALDNGEEIYCLETKNSDFKTLILDEIYDINPIRQIRA